jgi:hypothetical protein
MERERPFNPSPSGSKPPGSAIDRKHRTTSIKVMRRPLKPQNTDRYRGGPPRSRGQIGKVACLRGRRLCRFESDREHQFRSAKHRVKLPHCPCGETGSSPVQIATLCVSLGLPGRRCRAQEGLISPLAADSCSRSGSIPDAPTIKHRRPSCRIILCLCSMPTSGR